MLKRVLLKTVCVYKGLLFGLDSDDNFFPPLEVMGRTHIYASMVSGTKLEDMTQLEIITMGRVPGTRAGPLRQCLATVANISSIFNQAGPGPRDLHTKWHLNGPLFCQNKELVNMEYSSGSTRLGKRSARLCIFLGLDHSAMGLGDF